jgi:hypothetical protein
MFAFVIVTVDDEIQSIKHCELSTVVITEHGSSVSSPIAAGSSSCLTHTVAVCAVLSS